MTKKVFSKAVAAVLVAAMCMVMVFTGAVSAASKSATCTVTGGSYEVGAKDSFVIAEVTFASSDEFTAGSFVATGSGLTLVECSPAVDMGGDAPEVYINVSNKKVLFAGFTESATNDIKSYSSLTLILKFTVSDGQSLEKAAAGKTWTVNVTDIDITNTAEDTYTTPNTSGSIHVHNYGSATTANGIKTTTCSICGATKAEVVSTTGLSSNTLADTKYASLTFDKEGNTVLNALIPSSKLPAGKVYFIYSYKGDDAEKVTATAVDAGTDASGNHLFPCAGDAGVGRISRQVTGNFVVVNGNTVTVSAEWTYSIKQYAETLASTGTATEKNYAKALVNYGYETTKILGYDTSAYTTTHYDITNWSLPASKSAEKVGNDPDWTIAGVSVKTGFKPKMNIKFNAATVANKDTVTIQIKDGSKVLYFKEIATDLLTNEGNGKYTYVLSDVPTKYLTGEIIIGAKKGSDTSAMTIKYSYGRYAKARVDKDADDADVFQALMNWAYYLGQAF